MWTFFDSFFYLSLWIYSLWGTSLETISSLCHSRSFVLVYWQNFFHILPIESFSDVAKFLFWFYKKKDSLNRIVDLRKIFKIKTNNILEKFNENEIAPSKTLRNLSQLCTLCNWLIWVVRLKHLIFLFDLFRSGYYDFILLIY